MLCEQVGVWLAGGSLLPCQSCSTLPSQDCPAQVLGQREEAGVVPWKDSRPTSLHPSHCVLPTGTDLAQVEHLGQKAQGMSPTEEMAEAFHPRDQHGQGALPQVENREPLGRHFLQIELRADQTSQVVLPSPVPPPLSSQVVSHG